MNVLVDAVLHFEHVQVISCDIKPGLAERSVDPEKNYTPPTSNYHVKYFFFAPLIEIRVSSKKFCLLT
jgi:hypothetical protein